MSMSQEEIEALMNGLDFDESESKEQAKEETKSPESMSEEDINKLIEETEEVSNDTDSSEITKEESIDEILSSLESSDDEDDSSDQEETNIDDILKELDATNSNEDINEDTKVEDDEPLEECEDNFDDILNSIEGLTEETTVEETTAEEVPVETKTQSSSKEPEDNLDHKINSGVFPFPVEEDTKVVNQLSAVASDSEEKATKIFDVLSNILDYNNAIQNDIHALSSFNEKQIAMLSSLSQKFPNINAFQQNLDQANEMAAYINDANEKINDGSTEIFQAMELMQYHDINRQKIERVMSVIRKLSTYLNNLFEDENNRTEVAVAKHIHGDTNDDLVGDDDLEALIAEFNK